MTRDNRKRYKKVDRTVVMWRCPACDFRVTHTQLTSARSNYLCPRCKAVHLSDYIMVE